MLTNSLWLAWLLPAFPALAFVLILFVAGKREKLSTVFALSGITLTLITALVLFIGYAVHPGVYEGGELAWYQLGYEQTTTGIYIDGTAAITMLAVPIVCLMIFIYSIGYMQGDSRYSLFFAYISLFSAGMMGLIVFDNLLALFLCWEIMGTCSYLLIGFWYEKEVAYKAGLKAFLVTKTGDLFLVLGVVLLYAHVGSLQYSDLLSHHTLDFLAGTPFMGNISLATMGGALIFLGAMGKSAQFPLHVWLPDAMAGPTPASSLIHAATMVSAGVYLLIRMFPLLEIGGVLPLIAAVGAFTALFAAIIALTQNDIKRVLAFSTISQLGYMVAAVGIGAPEAALFHLITHAVFKALLFMSAGSVIHGMEHGYHHAHHGAHGDFDPNELFLMGSLGKRMPLTALSFTAGAMALSGFPLFSSGFWSKDEIIASAWPGHQVVFWMLVVAAGLTALYTGRELILAFLGKARSESAKHAPESSKWMTRPILILGVLALTIGWLGIPDHFPVVGGKVLNVVSKLLHPAVVAEHAVEHAVSHGEASLVPLAMSVSVALGGLVLAWLIYGRGRENSTDVIQQRAQSVHLQGLYAFAQDRFRVDAIYSRFVVEPCLRFSTLCSDFDSGLIDGIVNHLKDIVVGAAGGISWADDNLIDNAVKGVNQAVVGVAGGTSWADDNILDRSVNVLGGTNMADVAEWVDNSVIDRPANLFAAISRALSALLYLTDNTFLDGFVSTIASGVRHAGRLAKNRQSGVLTDYLWNAFVMVLLLIAGMLFFQW